MKKSELRTQMRSLLKRLSQRDALLKSRAVTQHLLTLPCWQDAQVMLAFCAMPGEVETRELMRIALEQQKIVGIPRIEGDVLVFHRLAQLDAEFVVHPYGIKEPSASWPILRSDAMAAQSVLILTPGLAFDRRKQRLGRGKGFYDRFFQSLQDAQCRRTTAVGICFAAQLVAQIPVTKYDLPVDAVITEEEILM